MSKMVQGEGGRTGDGLSTTGVEDAQELLRQIDVLVVVPVTQDDGELFIVLVRLDSRVDDERRAESIDILTLGR